MKISMRNFAKNAALACLLASSSPLLANAGDLNLEKINDVEVLFGRHHHHHHRHSERQINSSDVPFRVFLSEELWKLNMIYLKDAIQVLAAPAGTFGSNEFSVVNALVNQSAVRIGNSIRYDGINNSAAVTSAIQLINTYLYSYIEAFRVGSDDLPIIIELLQDANESLYEALIVALALPVCDRPSLRIVLEDRLLSLKELSLAFLSSEIGEYDDVYITFTESLFESQKVGRFIGNRIVGIDENLEGNSSSEDALLS